MPGRCNTLLKGFIVVYLFSIGLTGFIEEKCEVDKMQPRIHLNQF